MTDKMIASLVTNAPLVIPLILLYWWATPRLVRATLNNGGGDIVKRIVREANAEQSKEHAESISAVRERLAVLETRVHDQRRN